FSPAPADLWAKLTDVRFLVQCIPDVQTVSQLAPDHAVCILRPGFAFVRGTLEVTLRVTELVAPTSAKVLVHSKGIGTTSDVEATLTLAAEGAGTRLHWVADIKNLGGLLKAVPQGLIRGAAQKVVGDALTAVETQLKREAQGASGAG